MNGKRIIPAIIILIFSSRLPCEPIKNASNLTILESGPTAIKFSVEINEQYNWSESDSVITLFFGIPHGASFKLRVCDVSAEINEEDEICRASEVGIMHGLRLGTIDIFPFSKSGAIHKLVLELRFSSSYSEADRCDSPVFYRIFNAYLLNPPPHGIFRNAGRYLIISGIPFLSAANFLAEWKRKEGFEVKVVTTETAGTIPSVILNYIVNEYRNPARRPDFVLLYGDVEFPSGSLPDYGFSTYTSDYPYSLLDGSDYFPDVLLGRLPVDTQPEALVAASKIINYEKDPVSTNSGWLVRGTGVATYVHAFSAVGSVLWVRELLLRHSFTNVDTFFYGTTTITPSMIASSINNGVHYIDYRGWAGSNGWWEPQFEVSDVFALRNIGMTPIVTSIVCGTGEYGDDYMDPTFAEAWIRVGTPTAPRGGVAFFGTTDHSTHTRYNNPINEGFYFGAFELGCETIGEAVLAGKMELYARMVSERESRVRQYFHTYNLLGDPGLITRTGLPHSFNPITPPAISRSGATIELELRDNSTGDIVSGAAVSFYSPRDSLLIFAYSDEQGKSTIIVPSINADTAFLSISKRDFIPVIKKLPVLYNAPILSIRGIYLSDGTPGNFNSILEPGEGALLRLRLVSSARIQAPVILVDSPSQYISFDTTSFALSEINEGENDIILSIRGKSGLSSGESPIYLRVIGIDGSESSVMFYIPTQGPYIEVNNIIVADTVEGSDGDGQLEPGESALLWVELINNSFVNFETLLVSYSIRNGFASVNDYEPLKFISLIGRGGRRISSVPIKIKLSPLIPEGSTIEIGFWVNFSGTEQELEEYSLSVPARATYRVIGPDNYGYVCLSDMLIGVYPGAPSYSWAEVVPEFGGDGELILSSDDTVEVFELPFPLKFYGNTYTRITISSNGWVAPDSVPPFLFQFYNLPIPHPGGPWGIIAPFWDDLSPHIGGVYYYYDEPHHRIIYEWSNVPHASTGAIQTFEVIIYDANYYPTTTGDCEIVFQYKTVNDTDSEENFSTVGICSPYILDGIQYLYSRIYAPGAATIATGRALKFTTDLPLCNIFGKVTLEDGVEDVNARVYIPGGKETLTDRGGNYSLKMLPPDTSRIIATKRGYFPAETVLALVPYTTIRNVNFVLRKMPSPDSVSATKGDTNLVVSWAVREHLVPDSARIYRSQILGGNHSYIGTTSGSETSFIDTTAIPRAKYYYYVSLFYGEGESNLAGPDSGWIGSTSISEGIRTPEKISFWVYPNPFNSSLFLETNETGSYEILVHNILGNIVKTQQIKAPARVKLEFYNSPSGIYLLSLYKDKKIIEMKKILLLK